MPTMQTTVDTRKNTPKTGPVSAGHNAILAALKACLKDDQAAVDTGTAIVSSYESRLAEQDVTIQALQARLDWLEEQVRLAQHRRFGASSEKDAVQGSLFDEVEQQAEDSAEDADDDDTSCDDTTAVKGHRRKRRRITVSPDVPCEEVVHDLAEADKVCPHDGTALRKIGSEDSKQIQFIPAQCKVLHHRRLTYACPCCNQYLITADKPKQPIPKSMASASLLAGVATQKYVDGVPLYRQAAGFARMGVDVGRANLANWMIRAGKLSQAIINLLGDKWAEQPVVHMDETPVQVLKEPGKSAQSQSYMWVRASGGDHPVRLFDYDPTRKKSVPLALLSDETTTLMVDGYDGYHAACNDYGINRLGCWAHARRKFVDAKRAQPNGKTGKPDQALAWIAKLYGVEKACRDDPPDKRHAMRQEKAKPVIDKLKAWLDKTQPTTAPKSTLGIALVYLRNQWPRLVRYLDDGNYPIDNNLAERAIRPFTIGRKNWLFSDSQGGARASANLYSLVETAKANGINPHKYLERLFTDLPSAQTVEDFEALLPWHVKETLA